jgi:hypothetical protein
MIAENVNTHAYGDVHSVVLAQLRRRWSLSGRDGVGSEAGFDVFFESVLHCFCAPDADPVSDVLCRNNAAAEFAPACPVAREG